MSAGSSHSAVVTWSISASILLSTVFCCWYCSLSSSLLNLLICCYYRQGEIYTFGNNEYGQLGRQRKVGSPSIVEGRSLSIDHLWCFLFLVSSSSSCFSSSLSRLCLALESRSVVSVSCGQHHTLVLTSEGQVYGFGRNNMGQIATDIQVPQSVFLLFVCWRLSWPSVYFLEMVIFSMLGISKLKQTQTNQSHRWQTHCEGRSIAALLLSYPPLLCYGRLQVERITMRVLLTMASCGVGVLVTMVSLVAAISTGDTLISFPLLFDYHFHLWFFALRNCCFAPWSGSHLVQIVWQFQLARILF